MKDLDQTDGQVERQDVVNQHARQIHPSEALRQCGTRMGLLPGQQPVNKTIARSPPDQHADDAAEGFGKDIVL